MYIIKTAYIFISFIFSNLIIKKFLILYNYFRGTIHKSSVSEGWSMVFPGADRSVALRTQRFLYDKYKQRPAQVQTYFTLK